MRACLWLAHDVQEDLSTPMRIRSDVSRRDLDESRIAERGGSTISRSSRVTVLEAYLPRSRWTT
jgi:hypothetical protein